MSIRNTRRRIVAMVGLGAGILAASNVVCAQIPCSYDVQIIASPLDCGLGTVNTYGLGLNEHGAVVGYYRCPLWDHTEAFLWTADGGFLTLQRPQGVSSAIAVDINDAGIICGTLWFSGLGYRGFVYDNGEWTILPPVVDLPGAWSGASAINNDQIVVGERSITEDINPQNAYTWSVEKGFTDLGVMTGPSSFGSSISETGIVVGWTGNQTGSIANAFIWQAGDLTLLGSVPRGFTSQAAAVTNDAIVVGHGRIPLKGAPVGAGRAFVWEGGKFEMLGTLPDHTRSAASGITTEDQQVVGTSGNVDDNPNIVHGFIWRDGIMTNLNDLVSGDLEIVIRSAAAIVETGEIIANGHDPEPNAVAFLLIPLADPLGDLNGDCQIGVIDLLILLGSWGDRESPADLNDDGTVDYLDLRILLDNWG